MSVTNLSFFPPATEWCNAYYSAGRTSRFACNICGKNFLHPDSLKHHRSTHRGETRCPICHIVLSRIFNLKRHILAMHQHWFSVLYLLHQPGLKLFYDRVSQCLNAVWIFSVYNTRLHVCTKSMWYISFARHFYLFHDIICYEFPLCLPASRGWGCVSILKQQYWKIVKPIVIRLRLHLKVLFCSVTSVSVRKWIMLFVGFHRYFYLLVSSKSHNMG